MGRVSAFQQVAFSATANALKMLHAVAMCGCRQCGNNWQICFTKHVEPVECQ